MTITERLDRNEAFVESVGRLTIIDNNTANELLELMEYYLPALRTAVEALENEKWFRERGFDLSLSDWHAIHEGVIEQTDNALAEIRKKLGVE